MILSASRRTDIPACYPQWFLNRIRAGRVLVRNPMNHSSVSLVPLSPESIDVIVFWTKDPQPLMPYLQELEERGYPYCFQFTLTPYGRDLEQNLRSKAEIEDTFLALSQRIGPSRVFWRYDPIVLNDEIDINYHKREFSRLCKKLSGHTEQVTISFVDLYRKICSPLIRAIKTEEMQALAAFVGECAASYSIVPKSCCEDFASPLIQRGACIDRALLEKVCGSPLKLSPDKSQRSGCNCCESVDIGAYYTCKNGCVYCYAGQSASLHNPDSELLVGTVGPTDKITERKVQSGKLGQTALY